MRLEEHSADSLGLWICSGIGGRIDFIRGAASPGTCVVPLDTDSWFPPSVSPQQKALAYLSYRAPKYVALARLLAVDGWLTPAILEMTVRTERHHPQDLKKVWHYVARFGDLSSS